MTCPITVAAAAPVIPQPKPKTKMASRTVFTTAPTMLIAMVIFGLPSARTRCPPPVDRIKNGKPNAVILVYSIA